MGQAKIKEVAEMESWPRAVSLTIGDRLWLFALLPKEGDISNLRLLRELKEMLNTTDEENDKYEVKMIQGGVQINPIWLEDDKAQESARSFEMGRKAWDLIKTELVKLSTQKKLSINCIDLYDKFTDDARYAPKPPMSIQDKPIRDVSAQDIVRAAGN
jgi:hypothetical protein